MIESTKACVALRGWRQADFRITEKKNWWSNRSKRNQVQSKQIGVVLRATGSHSVNFLTKGFCGCKKFNTVQQEATLGRERLFGGYQAYKS